MRSKASVRPAITTVAAAGAGSTLLVVLTMPTHSSLLLWMGVIGLAASAHAWVALLMSVVLFEADAPQAGRAAGRFLKRRPRRT